MRDRKQVATALQFGPRFLHSTGQAYKGGPNSGVFLEITADPNPDLDIPGRKASFGVIEAAQARGDFRVLAERGRRVLHAHITGDVDAGLAADPRGGAYSAAMKLDPIVKRTAGAGRKDRPGTARAAATQRQPAGVEPIRRAPIVVR